jgi:hypothetical protein
VARVTRTTVATLAVHASAQDGDKATANGNAKDEDTPMSNGN